MKLKAYMAFLREWEHEEAMLVFARTAREARNISWFNGADDFIERRTKLLASQEFWMQFSPGKPQCVEPPRELCCEACNGWGVPNANLCGWCEEPLPNWKSV